MLKLHKGLMLKLCGHFLPLRGIFKSNSQHYGILLCR